jgi:competence ComEA-like helix-hairpin-helix protein
MSLKSVARSLALLSAVSVTSGLLSAPAPAQNETGRKTVNINQATADELARLPRVGSKLAGRVVTHRSQHGPFKRAEDLMAVKGVGEKKFASLKPYLAVSGSTTLTEKVSSAKGSRPAARPRAPGKAPKKASDTASTTK